MEKIREPHSISNKLKTACPSEQIDTHVAQATYIFDVTIYKFEKGQIPIAIQYTWLQTAIETV